MHADKSPDMIRWTTEIEREERNTYKTFTCFGSHAYVDKQIQIEVCCIKFKYGGMLEYKENP